MWHKCPFMARLHLCRPPGLPPITIMTSPSHHSTYSPLWMLPWLWITPRMSGLRTESWTPPPPPRLLATPTFHSLHNEKCVSVIGVDTSLSIDSQVLKIKQAHLNGPTPFRCPCCFQCPYSFPKPRRPYQCPNCATLLVFIVGFLHIDPPQTKVGNRTHNLQTFPLFVSICCIICQSYKTPVPSISSFFPALSNRMIHCP